MDEEHDGVVRNEEHLQRNDVMGRLYSSYIYTRLSGDDGGGESLSYVMVFR